MDQFEFLRQLSSDSKNLVIGLVRDKPTTDKKVSEELKGRSNVHILKGDLNSYDDMKVLVLKQSRYVCLTYPWLTPPARKLPMIPPLLPVVVSTT